MAFENLQIEIAMLLQQMGNQPQDKYELAAQIHEMLGEMKATGMPLPEDLVALEQQLEDEFALKRK